MTRTFRVVVEFTGPELSALADIAESRGVKVADYLHNMATMFAASPRRVADADMQPRVVELTDLGWSRTEIARRLCVSREKVRRIQEKEMNRRAAA